MLKFSEYLTEAAGEGMKSNISDVKTRGHVKRYVFPFLSSEQKKHSAENLRQILTDKDVEESDVENHGASHDPKAEHTHLLASKFEGNEKGTPVKVTGLHIDGNTVMAKTKNHGYIPISKLAKPNELAAANKTSEGFDLEHRIQKNIDPRFKPAGSSGESWDFVAGDPDSEHSIRGKAVKKDESKPIFRGEAKASKKGTVSMGTISATYNKDSGKWEYSQKTKSKMRDKFEEATHPQSGLSIIDHLNEYHPNGTLPNGFTIQAPQGTTAHYLNGIGANSLHLHRYAKDSKGNYTMNHGTTYTIGDDNNFQGKLGLGHLSNEDLNRLDGSITIEPAGVGKVQIKHKPKPAVFNEFANKSQESPDEHMDLSKNEHGLKFKENFANHIRSINMNSPRTPEERGSGEHGPVSFAHPNDPTHISNRFPQETGGYYGA